MGTIKGHIWKKVGTNGRNVYRMTTGATPTVGEYAAAVYNAEENDVNVGNCQYYTNGNPNYRYRIDTVNSETELKFNKKPETYTLRVCCYDSNAGDYVFNDDFQLNVPVGQNFIVDDYRADWVDWAQSVDYNSDGYSPFALGIEDEMIEDEYDLGSLENNGETPFGTLSRWFYEDTTFTLNELAKDQVITILMKK